MTRRSLLTLCLILVATFFSVGSTLVIVKDSPSALAQLGANWTERRAEEEITILFAGDVMAGRYIEVLRRRRGGDFPFTYMPEVMDAVKEALETEELDLVVGNLEGPISTSPYVNPGTAMIFNFKPDTAALLKKAGFTTLSMANNHSLDMGLTGFNETYRFLTAEGIHAYGHANTADGEFTFTQHDFDTKTIGFLGFNDAVYPLDVPTALAKIAEVDPQVDFLVVSVHWGIEYEPIARQNIQDLAREMVDAGADFIHGHHPHVIQNSEIYKGAPIYYSLGNFVFDQYWSQETQAGRVVGLKLQGERLSTTEIIVDLVKQGEPYPRRAQEPSI